MENPAQQTITFRCPPELEPILPRPLPAVLGLPDWFKTMPQKAYSAVFGTEQMTVKRCPPVIDAMTHGFLMPLVADLRVQDGELSWDRDVPGGGLMNYSRAPIDFHDNNQVIGTPFFDEDRFLIKFTNFWTFELPPGYSLLISHPFNRRDLPFVTLTGLVDADTYRDNFINFPAFWHDRGFQRRAAEGHAGRAMRAGQARHLDRAVRADRGRGGGAAAGTLPRRRRGNRRLPPPVSRTETVRNGPVGAFRPASMLFT